MRMVDTRVEVRRPRAGRRGLPHGEPVPPVDGARSPPGPGAVARCVSATSCPWGRAVGRWHPGTTPGACRLHGIGRRLDRATRPSRPRVRRARPVPRDRHRRACRGRFGGWSPHRAPAHPPRRPRRDGQRRARGPLSRARRPGRLQVVHNCARPVVDSAPDPRPTLLRDALDLAPSSPSSSTTASWTARAVSDLFEAILEPDLQRAHLVLLGAGQDRERLGCRAALRWPRPPAGSRPALRTCCPGWRRRTWARCRSPATLNLSCRRRTSCSECPWPPASRSW